MYLSCILERLNQKLTVASDKFAGAKYYKLAELVNRTSTGGTQQFPLVDETEIAIDDTYPVTVYHRLLSKPYSKINFNTFESKCQMVMVVFGNREKLQMDSDALESQFIALFPSQFSKADLTGLSGVTNVHVEIGSSNLSALDVFNTEYKNSRFIVDGQTILFSIRYEIQITFKKDCLDFCEAVVSPNSLCTFIEISSSQEIVDCLSESQQAAICDLLGCGMQNMMWAFGMGANGCDVAFTYDGASSLKSAYRCPPVSAIINNKAQAYTNGKINLISTAGQKKGKEASGYDNLKRLLRNPNYIQNWKDFEAQGYVYKQLQGYNVILIIKASGFSSNLDAIGMWNIPPMMLRIKEYKKYFYQKSIKDAIESISIVYGDDYETPLYY